jgi:hypothetical protein
MVEQRVPDIGRWGPKRWDQVLANEELVEHYQDLLTGILAGDRSGLNTMVLGPSRSGKTATTKFFARCVQCEELNPHTLNPCDGSCRSCREDVSRYGLSGLEVDVRGGNVHYVPIDCTSISAAELKKTLIELRDYDGVRIVYLDEVHRLCRQFMDEQLLKPVEERNFMWIASSASTEGLEKMFLNRFTKIRTSLPSEDDLAEWLAHRCGEWGIDWDEPETLMQLAERSRCVPGHALQVIARASKKPNRTLTGRLVERHVFDVEETVAS